MYAYDIIRETLSLSNNVYKMPLLYNILNKLEADNYIIQSRREISDNNRVRVYYKITEKGRVQLGLYKGEWSSYSGKISRIFEEAHI